MFCSFFGGSTFVQRLLRCQLILKLFGGTSILIFEALLAQNLGFLNLEVQSIQCKAPLGLLNLKARFICKLLWGCICTLFSSVPFERRRWDCDGYRSRRKKLCWFAAVASASVFRGSLFRFRCEALPGWNHRFESIGGRNGRPLCIFVFLWTCFTKRPILRLHVNFSIYQSP